MLVYLHGLNSSSRSDKANRLRDGLAPYPVIAVDYDAHRPATAIAQLHTHFSQLGATEQSLVIGSSMGGFYGQYLARHCAFAHLYLINPALTPWTLLADRIGEVMTSAQGERYRITQSLIEATRPYGIDHPCDGTPTTLFLERGDEVIDAQVAETRYRDCGRLFVWDGGDHAFQHLDAVIACLRQDLSL